MRTLIKWLMLICVLTNTALAQSTQDTFAINDERFDKPLVFNVQLPKSYVSKPDKRYVLLFDFHPYSHTYLSGLHDWMSHNGEWPWLETIIVTPAYGNPVGKLFDESGETTRLIDFFASQLIPEIDKQYRTNKFRIISGFRTNGTIVLSTLLNKPELFNAYIAISPELKKDYAQILSKLKNKDRLKGGQHCFLLFSHASTIKEDHQLPTYQTLNQGLAK
ncbi:alpha/beta hydrolase-fold protein [Thalassotalea atypica]|uniref:alpha/beta hydrolase-fold protein n=1 Tax=Thalassotalea atypica TaxID=2054316 RepID=UPI002573D07B|nr:alpha/beta hydrolase-fold protein [Thalassotalea atypica]